MTTTLRIENLWAGYGPATALFGISAEVAAGSVLAVLGANGAGKSTLARVLSGLVPVRAGQVLFDGVDVTGWSAHRLRREGIVHLPEGRGVFTTLSVADNLRMAVATLPRRDRPAAVDRAYELFPALHARRTRPAGVLSGGEQQMLSLSRALVLAPRLLVADELSLGLAPRMVEAVFDGLRRAREAGTTIVMIEQFVHRALGFADMALVLQRGKITWAGAAGDAGDTFLEQYLGATAPESPPTTSDERSRR